MDNRFYKTIFKRKSFHLFRHIGNDKLSEQELIRIKETYKSFECLYPNIKTDIQILKASEVGLLRGCEYSILLYSEKKDNYLMNIGYLGEQLDLYCVDNNIATLWYGIGKPKQKVYNGLYYVIEIGISKVSNESLFRKDMFKAKRKEINEIWDGTNTSISNIVRFAPSACNTQPWYVKETNNSLEVYRYKSNKRGIMPKDAISYFNRIDIGIFLCFLDICLANENIKYEKELFIDDDNSEYIKVATYRK